jgi:putative exporter of polyketide antibiotics
MRIAKPLLLIVTPLGVAAGLYEAYRLAGGLVVLMVMMLTVVTVAIASVVTTIRREREEERKARERDSDAGSC